MFKFLAWTICIYVLLKLAHLVVKPAPDYGERPPTLAALIHAGEPTLLIISLSLATLITLYTNWWVQRLGEREYVHAKGCYVELETARRLYRTAHVDPYRIENQANIHIFVAEKHGAWIGISRDAVHQDFERARIAYFNRYLAASGQGVPHITPALFRELDRCFRDEWESHGEIFNP